MSKKDYEALADALAKVRPASPLTADSSDLEIGKTIAWQASCLAVANVCSDLSPRFNRAQFLAMCQAG